ncbi:MAG: hypothetical protein PHE32_01160 [Candidatus Shapirobacteria bacterium]|nr:hypothetical protein [Candidatus Shapirobacteria bacterium]MDD4410300.1 hypothetical protein [Candidatus Shapirobacteria bacterium]
MTKIRLTIYISLLVLILSALIICIFGLTKKDKPVDQGTIEITLSPVIEITWPEAVNLIQNCQIKSIFQKRKLEVTLTAKDSRVYKTTEPKFNDIFTETNNLRSDCNDIIQTITE